MSQILGTPISETSVFPRQPTIPSRMKPGGRNRSAHIGSGGLFPGDKAAGALISPFTPIEIPDAPFTSSSLTSLHDLERKVWSPYATASVAFTFEHKYIRIIMR
jgi:hypothetical protein